MNLNESLHRLEGIEFLENENLTGLTTFKLNSVGDLVRVKSVQALCKLLPLLNTFNKSYLVIGWGANQILPEKCDEIIIHLEFPVDLSCFDFPQKEYTLPASLGINHLTAHAVKFGLKGWEVITGIPASLGGAIYMNAGTNLGEIGRLVKSVKLVTPKGEIREEMITQDSFSYRKNHFVRAGEIIIEAVIMNLGIDDKIPQLIKEYLDYRKNTQPLATKNCGCVFKNPAKDLPVGKLIDLLKLKGLRSGDLRISPKHGNFMENTGKATWSDFQLLVEQINFQMDHFYGIEFELEVKIPYH